MVVLGMVRLLLTPLFIRVEYRLPGFPPDPYGFSTADRLQWAEICRQYLLNDAPIDFLAGRQLPDGSPLFNARELRHMHDVKRVVQGSLRVWYFSWVLLLLLGAAAHRWGWWEDFRRGLFYGGWLTAGSMLLLAALSVVAFQTVFTDFHHVFFEGDSWLFLYTDSLIRLFPERFWQDSFLLVGGLSVLIGRAIAYAAQRR